MNAWNLREKRTKPRESELVDEKPGVYTKRENSAVVASKEFILALHYGLRVMVAMTLRQKRRRIRKQKS